MDQYIPTAAEAVLILRRVNRVLIRGCRPSATRSIRRWPSSRAVSYNKGCSFCAVIGKFRQRNGVRGIFREDRHTHYEHESQNRKQSHTLVPFAEATRAVRRMVIAYRKSFRLSLSCRLPRLTHPAKPNAASTYLGAGVALATIVPAAFVCVIAVRSECARDACALRYGRSRGKTNSGDLDIPYGYGTQVVGYVKLAAKSSPP